MLLLRGKAIYLDSDLEKWRTSRNTGGRPPGGVGQEQRQHKQPPPPSLAWCSYLPGRGCAFVNEQNLNAHSFSLHRTPVRSAFLVPLLVICFISSLVIALEVIYQKAEQVSKVVSRI